MRYAVDVSQFFSQFICNMEELFDQWNREKKLLDSKSKLPFLNEREIRFIKLWKNIGCEENGKTFFLRPFLIIKKVGTLFRWVPLTTWWKDSLWYMTFPSSSFTAWRHQKWKSRVCLWHARTIDPRRCTQRIWILNNNHFQSIKKSLQMIYL